MSERDFRQLVLDLASTLGWCCYFTWRSDHSPAGFPDLVLARRGDTLRLWELKTMRGRLSPEQEGWAAVLTLVPGVDYRIIRPADWPWIVRTLGYEA